MTTLDEARAVVMERRWDKGGHPCPCCGQVAKVYHRHISGASAKVLADARWKYGVGEPFEMKTVPDITGGDAAKLTYWRLLEALPAEGRGARFAVTRLGALFIDGRCSLPRTAMVYDGVFLDWEDTNDRVTVFDVLGKRFSYDDLMANR